MPIFSFTPICVQRSHLNMKCPSLQEEIVISIEAIMIKILKNRWRAVDILPNIWALKIIQPLKGFSSIQVQYMLLFTFNEDALDFKLCGFILRCLWINCTLFDLAVHTIALHLNTFWKPWIHRQETDRPKAQLAANGALLSAFEFATHSNKKETFSGLIEVKCKVRNVLVEWIHE